MSNKYNIGDIFFDINRNANVIITDVVFYHLPSFFVRGEAPNNHNRFYEADLSYRLKVIDTGGTFGFSVAKFDVDTNFTKVA